MILPNVRCISSIRHSKYARNLSK